MLKKQKSNVAHKAWRLLRLALLWARKGGVLKNRLIMDLRLVPKYLKNLRHANDHQHGAALHYGERELSFDDTPIIHIKMHRPASLRFKMPNMPCIKPPAVDFDYDFDNYNHDDDACDHYNEEIYCNDFKVARKSFLKGAEDDIDVDQNDDDDEVCDQEMINGPCDDEIDLKAEKFIAKFYEQMKLQRQISYLQYNEMLNTGANY